jgi:hypothetical protein
MKHTRVAHQIPVILKANERRSQSHGVNPVQAVPQGDQNGAKNEKPHDDDDGRDES